MYSCFSLQIVPNMIVLKNFLTGISVIWKFLAQSDLIKIHFECAYEIELPLFMFIFLRGLFDPENKVSPLRLYSYSFFISLFYLNKYEKVRLNIVILYFILSNDWLSVVL